MRYHIEDTIVDTDNATACWTEATDWDGSNHISRNTRSQWAHEVLYLSRKGRYYLVSHSDWQGSQPSAEFVSDEEAAKWLLLNDEELPADLAKLEEAISE